MPLRDTCSGRLWNRWNEGEDFVRAKRCIFAVFDGRSGGIFLSRRAQNADLPPVCLPFGSFLWGMVLGWEEAGFLCVCRLPLDRTDFELLQRAVVPALVPPLRKHLTDPECNTAELCFLLHAGLVVGGLLRGRVCPWWPLGEREGREGALKAVCTWIWSNEPDVWASENVC